MAELQLKSHRFRQEREADWRRLDRLLERVERGSAASLSYDEMVALPGLYRSALSSLSVARAISLDRSLVEYLEGLCTRAYFFVYGPRSTLVERLAGFFRDAWPRAVKALWRETLWSLALMLAGTAAGWILVARDPDWFYAFVSRELASGRDPSATTQYLKKVLYDGGGGHSEGLSVLATFLFTHNAQVALMAFALGFALCVPTAFLMISTGTMMGAFMALYVLHGLGFQLGGWMFIHGTTELFAVTLAGGAGFKIGWTVAFPGGKTRVDALAEAGKQAATVMGGVVVMLFAAGLLEGFARQLIKADLVRYAIALGMLALWCVYFYAPRASLPPRGGREVVMRPVFVPFGLGSRRHGDR
jgi:uncharacterized membrane protein SpoIIM required for sporulation